MAELVKNGGNIMGTRATAEDYKAVKELLSDAEYYETARIIAVRDMESDGEETMEQRRSVAVITAGTADIPVAEEAAVTAGMLGNRVDRI